jgi:hypothetical protein
MMQDKLKTINKRFVHSSLGSISLKYEFPDAEQVMRIRKTLHSSFLEFLSCMDYLTLCTVLKLLKDCSYSF